MNTLDKVCARIDKVVGEVEREESWKFLLRPSTSAEEIETLLAQVFLRICWYQPRTVEAGFHMLGRLPKSETQLLKSLLNHKAEEALHGTWARRDYGLLGGKEQENAMHLSPACFAVVGTWWLMANAEDPFGYLGAEFLFEELTARLCGRLVPLFKGKGVRLQKIEFITEHATEDVKHSNLIRHWIADIGERYPRADESMLRCFDYFNQVYPLPVWREAYEAFRNRNVIAAAVGDIS
jgi:hypothetical protein